MSYYGIDLGTTYSLIGKGNKLLSGLVSSSVNVKEGKQCDRHEHGDDIVSSYKINMTMGQEGKLPIECSSVILRELVNRAERTDVDAVKPIKDIVVSVPAKFTHSQREAVCKAAEKAGLTIRGLINEPTAAAIYTCRDVKDLVVVYDLGGGTFDVSIVDSRAGSYYVLATDGRILAGDNFDEALAELVYKKAGVKVRFRLGANHKIMLSKIRVAKETIQKTNRSYFIDMREFGVSYDCELTVDEYVKCMKDTFAETIRVTNRVIDTSIGNLESPKIIFVGGSTACPYLKEWVCKETGLTPIISNEQPDYIVAKGVALYAEMLESGKAEKEVEDVTKRLCIENKYGQAITIIAKNTNIPVEQTLTVVNDIKSDSLSINLYQGDSILVSDNEYIGTLEYKYDCVKEEGEGLVELILKVDRDGRIRLEGKDILTDISQHIDLVVR